MPLLWKYLLRHFFRVFFLICSGFIILLFVSRLKLIARFASIATDPFIAFKYLLLQVPHILPLAIPISAFFAAFILFRQMSSSHELPAFRSVGIKLTMILQPIVMASLFLSLITLYLCSEINPKAKYEMRRLYTDKTSKNPLFLLQQKELLPLSQAYLSADVAIDQMKNVVFVSKDPQNHNLFLITAKMLSYLRKTLKGDAVSSLFFVPDGSNETTLFMENERDFFSIAPELSQTLKQNKYRLNPSSLPFAQLLISAKKKMTIIMEAFRRISLALCPFTFTWLGAVYGIQMGRQTKDKMWIAFSLLALVLICYLAGKQLKAIPLFSIPLLILPHLTVWLVTKRKMQLINEGKV
jgi:lipopolysaccharide export LptBFGC system permease protein LptF